MPIWVGGIGNGWPEGSRCSTKNELWNNSSNSIWKYSIAKEFSVEFQIRSGCSSLYIETMSGDLPLSRFQLPVSSDQLNGPRMKLSPNSAEVPWSVGGRGDTRFWNSGCPMLLSWCMDWAGINSFKYPVSFGFVWPKVLKRSSCQRQGNNSAEGPGFIVLNSTKWF